MSQEPVRYESDSAVLLPVIALPPHFDTFFPKTESIP